MLGSGKRGHTRRKQRMKLDQDVLFVPEPHTVAAAAAVSIYRHVCRQQKMIMAVIT
jgi:hypothetical protein